MKLNFQAYMYISICILKEVIQSFGAVPGSSHLVVAEAWLVCVLDLISRQTKKMYSHAAGNSTVR